MALWRDDKTAEEFDDGLALRPGEDGFSRDEAAKHFGKTAFSYVGTPNWQPPVEQADEVGA